jgi:DNA polymerase-3 subunit gamma/tau
VFVLATTEAHKVMPTIVDRCQRFDFQRPAPAQIADVLGRVAGAEGIEIEDGAVAAIARAANGSFRDALGTLDQLVAYGGGPVETGDVLAVLGVADAELIFAAADAIAAGDGRAALETVERLARSGRDATQFIRDLVAHLRQLLVIDTAETVPESFALTAGQEERLRAQVEQIGDVALVRAIDELSAALSAIRDWGDDPRTALELALLKAARPDSDPSREALAQRIDRLERGFSGPVAVEDPAPASGDVPPQRTDDPPASAEAAAPRTNESRDHAAEASAPQPGAPSAATATAVEAVDLERVAGLWPAVLDQVGSSGSELLSAVFQAARPLAVDAERAIIEVGFPPSAAFNKRKAESQANRERLAEAVRTIVGESLRPVYVLLEEEEGDGVQNGDAALGEEELIARIKAEFDAEEDAAQEDSA